MGLAMLVLQYLLDLDLSTVAERIVLSTVVVGIPPLCTMSSAPSPMMGFSL
jgi:hypothetical protein